MLVGINYPWIDYGWDFGDPPAVWIPGDKLNTWREAKRRRIEDDFVAFAAKGIFAVRWFLLADGLNYGMGERVPRKDRDDWSFDPLPGGHPFYDRFLDDFEFVLQVCRKTRLKLFPSLIDFGWCQNGTPVAGSPGLVKGGRYGILRDPEKRQAFFDRLLDPLLACSMRYRDSVYAWELINEPEWVIRGFWKSGANRNVTRKEMKQFVAEGNQRIRARTLDDGMPAFRTSIGFAHWETSDSWNAEKLGITLHQFHYYAQQNCRLPASRKSAGRPAIVGEFATAAGRDWPDLADLNKEQNVTNRLSCIEAKGYPACFIWSATAVDPATRWTDEVQKEVVAYNSLKQPDRISV